MNVWVTRDEGDDGPLSTALRDAGLTPILQPVIARRVVDDCHDAIAALGIDDWLVLTSTFAIEAVPENVSRVPNVAVVGEKTKQAAQARGFRVHLVSSENNAESLFVALRQIAVGTTVCYPRSSAADLPSMPSDVHLVSPVLYETCFREFDPTVLQRVDIIAVCSPSAVRAIGRIDARFASIGATTSTALRELGIIPWVEAPTPGFESLARSIADQANDSLNQRA